MEILHSLKLNKKEIPNYVIPLALVQAEIFWICSALYCIFSNTRLYKNKKLNGSRIRSNSAPASSKPSLPLQLPVCPSASVSASTKIQLETINEETNDGECSISELRRASLPESCIRHRPSIKDELNGTTCPPVWWQKTRVLFGHTPIHENIPSISLTNPEKELLKDTIILSSASSVISTNSLAKYDLQSSLKSTKHHIEHLELSRHSTHSSSNSDSDSDSDNSLKRKTKLVSKIRAVFQHKRNKN